MLFRRRSPSPPAAGATPKPRTGLDFSLNGLIYCCIMMFMGLAAINSGANLLYGVFGLMIGILIVAAVLSRKVLRKLTVHRVLPDHATVGVPTSLAYQVTNGKRFWPSLAVHVSEIEGSAGMTEPVIGYLLHGFARTTVEVHADLIPLRRGLHHFDRFQLTTSFPFGFIRRMAMAKQEDTLLVYPAIGQVDRAVIALCRAAEHSGATIRPRAGGQDDFFGVKEHRPGDNPRNIYWRRSASLGPGSPLIAKEMTQVAPPRLVLLVDTFQADGTPESSALVEKTISMAASVASAALDDDLSVGLLVWTQGWKQIEPSRGKRHRADLLSILARIPRNTTAVTQALVEQGLRGTRTGATAMLFSSSSSAISADGLRQNALVAVTTDSPQAARWFQWPTPVDFTQCIPGDQVTASSESSQEPIGIIGRLIRPWRWSRS